MTSRRRGVLHRGGISRYAQAERDIRAWIREDRNADARFTTMFDLYRLPKDFPGYGDAASLPDPHERVTFLENALSADIADPRFVPYFQLHEFEALLLSDPKKFDSQFPDCEGAIRQLVELASEFGSPELIDDGDDTAPSRRIAERIPDYEKMKRSEGPVVAEMIGLPTLRSKCEHFGGWLETLEALR